MPQAVPIAGRKGTYVLLQAALPDSPVHNIGVLLADRHGNRMFLRLRSRFDDIVPPEDREVFAAIEEDIRQRAAAMGALEYLDWLADTASNTIRISEPETVEVDSFTRVLDRLFDRHVERVTVEPYRTHLPLYPARAAAGAFSAEQPAGEEPEDWVPAPGQASRDRFVMRVTGSSMEPRIPAGSLNVFRRYAGGSRQGKIVLVELLNVRDDAARYTVKRYTSVKRPHETTGWEHERIVLLPFNRDYEPIELEPADLKVIGEWVCTLD